MFLCLAQYFCLINRLMYQSITAWQERYPSGLLRLMRHLRHIQALKRFEFMSSWHQTYHDAQLRSAAYPPSPSVSSPGGFEFKLINQFAYECQSSCSMILYTIYIHKACGALTEVERKKRSPRRLLDQLSALTCTHTDRYVSEAILARCRIWQKLAHTWVINTRPHL